MRNSIGNMLHKELITNTRFDANKLFGNTTGKAILTDVTDGYDYKDGKKTDVVTHQKYVVAIAERQFEKLTVKIAGTKPIITAEQLAQKGGHVNVQFKNLTGKLYSKDNGYELSCSADGIEVVS